MQRRGGVEALRHNSTTAQRHNGTTAQRHNRTTAQRRNGATAQRHNGTTAQRHRGTTAQGLGDRSEQTARKCMDQNSTKDQWLQGTTSPARTDSCHSWSLGIFVVAASVGNFAPRRLGASASGSCCWPCLDLPRLNCRPRRDPTVGASASSNGCRPFADPPLPTCRPQRYPAAGASASGAAAPPRLSM